MGKTKVTVSEAVNSTGTPEETTLRALARVWPAAIAARATRAATDVEIHAGAEFQQIKAELRTNFE
jgi:S-adenosylmethionine:tRNA-ribosyltransferase-isomerase (queuine synthetase)